MEIVDTAIAEVKIVRPVQHHDQRGFFSETYNKRALAAVGIELDFVQDNHTLSPASGTIRGLHFQTPPHAQAKLVRVVRGAVFDVAVDIRHGSPTFGQHVATVLNAADWHQLLVPAGFAHGCCTLEPDTEVLYKVTRHYSPAHDEGVLWNDPALMIPWPVDEGLVIVSARDRAWPTLSACPAYFQYDGAGNLG